MYEMVGQNPNLAHAMGVVSSFIVNLVNDIRKSSSEYYDT